MDGKRSGEPVVVHLDPATYARGQADLASAVSLASAGNTAMYGLIVQAADRLKGHLPAVYLGNRRVKVGDAPPLVVTEMEDCVISAVVEAGGACDIDELKKKSGVSDAPRVFKNLAAKYSELAPHIIAPGGKGQGGYRTTIVQGK